MKTPTLLLAFLFGATILAIFPILAIQINL